MTEKTDVVRSRAGWLRELVLLLAALAIGWWAHGGRNVQAASPGDFQFQMQGSDLLIYSASSHTVSVYKDADRGNSALACSYEFLIGGSRAPVERKSCDMGRLTP